MTVQVSLTVQCGRPVLVSLTVQCDRPVLVSLTVQCDRSGQSISVSLQCVMPSVYRKKALAGFNQISVLKKTSLVDCIGLLFYI